MNILYEDNHLIAVVKKPGQTVQPEPGKPVSLETEVREMIRKRDSKPGDVFLGVIHRLDMPVGGIVIFAKTSKALARMNVLFQKREVKKIYHAWVENHPPAKNEKITHWLKRDEKKNMTKAYVTETSGADKAELIYTVLRQSKGETLLEIELLTGRKHQIRAQLSAIGSPITGDVKYGAGKGFPDQHIRLTSVELSFIHPVKQEQIHLKIASDREI